MILRKLTYVVSVLFMFILLSSCEQKSSLTFVIDKTMSMRDDINQVIESATDIMNIVHKKQSSQIENVVLVTFDDPEFGLVVKTNDLLELQRHLYKIEVIGNWDCPEMSMSGTKVGLQESLPGSYVYVFTDDDPKDYQLVDEVQNLAQKNQNQVVFIITPNNNCDPEEKSFKEYYKIAAATYGQVFRLTEKSDVKSVLTYVEETISGQRTPVTSKLIPPNIWSEINFEIDEKSEYGIVSTSGEGVELIVKKSPSDHEKLTWLGNVKIIKVKASGDYTIRVKGSGTTSVSVFGRTDFTFKHGFSVFKPRSLNETTAQPIAGQKSHLSIKIIDKEGDVDVKIARILDMDENTIMEKSLELINKKEMNFYVTEPFDPPTSIFKIEVVGYTIKTNKKITRKSQTPIQPQTYILANVKNISPEIVIEGGPLINAEYDQPLELKCIVTAFPEPVITWREENAIEVLKTKVTALELNYKYVSKLDIDKVNKNSTYQCKAINSQGEDQKVINIETKRKTFFEVLEIPKDTAISYEDSGNLKCKVSAFPPANITWYRNGKIIKNDKYATVSDDSDTLTIKNMQLEAEGHYMCKMQNELKQVLFHANVTITDVDSPQVEKFITDVRVLEGSSATINCRVIRGRPKPSVTWFYNNDPMSTSKITSPFQEIIEFPSVSRNEAGIYKCKANNIIGNDSHETNLIVEYAPSIKESKTDFFEKDGTGVTLHCDVDSIPAPSVEWRFRGEPIMNKQKHINPDYSLSFVATLKDAGNYICIASNIHGNSSKTAFVNIYVPPVIYSKAGKKKVLMDKSLSLSCLNYGYPKPSINWKFISNDKKLSPKTLRAKSDSIELSKIKTSQNGKYICTASNVGGITDITYEVIVETPPEIISYLPNKMLRAVKGDSSICIPCNATGSPKPVISWLQAGYPLALDEMHLEEDGTLCIENVDKSVEGYYTCEAQNYLGTDYESFHITVDDCPKSGYPTTRIMIEMGTPAIIKCNQPHLKTNHIRWYKENQYITDGELILNDPQISDAGIYTCRINYFKTSANSYLDVVIGSKPRFHNNQESELIEFEKDSWIPLDCFADGLPNPTLQIRWWHNSKIMSHSEYLYIVGNNIEDRGEYVCAVSNEFGNITRRFVVESDECLLNTKTEFTELHPIILTTQLEWPVFEKLEGHIRIPSGEKILLYCPDGFEDSNMTEVIVSCYKEKEFEYEGSIVEFADLTCKVSSKPTIKGTGRRCLSSKTELIQIGYELRGNFLKVYELCFDKYKRISVYAKQNIDQTLADSIPNNIKWFDSALLPMDFESLYNCSVETKNIESLSYQWSRKNDHCCFSKRQLVNARDVFPGLVQTSTYSHLNVMPHWSTCNEENWNEVENRIRLLATNYDFNLEVWTGTSQELKLPDAYGYSRKVYIKNGLRGQKQTVPLYIWKVVRDPENRKSLAIIQVNIPDLDISITNPWVMCEDICSKVTWMTSDNWHDPKRGYTYCCSLQGFSKAFGIRGLYHAEDDEILQSITEIPGSVS